MIKRIQLIFIGLIVVQTLFAQSNKLPERKHNPTRQYLVLRDYLEEHNFEYTFGYSQTKLVNPIYGESIEKSKIKPLYGYYFNVRYNKALPLIFELGYNNSIFETKDADYFNFKANEKIIFNGFEANANFVLMPSARFFMPYIGVGYGFYSASVGSNLFDTKSTRYYTETSNSPFFKTGVTINFHQVFYLNAEYKQSLTNDKPFDFSQINAGIGFRLGEDFLYENHRDYFEDYPVDYSFGYSLTKFNNQPYSENLSNSTIKNLYGYYFNVRYTKVLPLIFDFGFNNSVFETDADYFKFKGGEKITFTGFEAGANLTLPNATFLLPYIGAGYGYYTSSVGTSVFDSEAKRVYKNSSGEPFWKIGLTINTGRTFFFNTEFKQSFKKDNELAFSQFNAGIGFRIEGENFFKGNVKDDFEEDKVILTYGYHQTDFINSTFKGHLKNGNIKRTWGNTVNLRITAAYPLMFDLGYFSSQFTVEDVAGWQNADTVKVRHRGGELAVLLPLLSKTKYFIPYLGAGYQISQLYVGPPLIEESGKDYSDIVEMAKNTSSPIYKLGVMFNFELMSYSIEYKHSLFNDKMPFYQLSANLGFKF